MGSTRRNASNASFFGSATAHFYIKPAKKAFWGHLAVILLCVGGLILGLGRPCSAAPSQRLGVDLTKELDPEEAESLRRAAANADKNPQPSIDGMAVVMGGQSNLGQAWSTTMMLQAEVSLNHKNLGILLMPRLRIDDLGDIAQRSQLLFQQAFAFAELGRHTLKVGRMYGLFGRMWDYGFYGPLLANFDIKLAPDVGVSAEGSLPLSKAWELGYAAQYFVLDGRAISVSHRHLGGWSWARRQNGAIVRINPIWHGHGDDRIAFAGSGQTFFSTYSHAQVYRAALELEVVKGPVESFVELTQQFGRDQMGDTEPLPPFSSLWAGARFGMGKINGRYHINVVRLQKDFADSVQSTSAAWEILHQPGVAYTPNDKVSVALEMGITQRLSPTPAQTYTTTGLFVVLMGHT